MEGKTDFVTRTSPFGSNGKGEGGSDDVPIHDPENLNDENRDAVATRFRTMFGSASP